MRKGDVSFYLDTLLIETALGNTAFTKTAQGSALSGLADMVKNYFSAHWDPNNRADSVLNMLAPTAISAIFRGLGFGKLGLLFGLVASTLHIDVGGMIHKIYDAVKEKLEQGQPIAPSELDNAVSSAVQGDMPATSDQLPAMDKRNFDKELRDARLVRLSLEQYETQMFQLTKEGQRSSSWFSSPGRRTAAGSLIGRIIGWVFKIILMSAGFMVAGDVAAKMLGRPSALDQTWHAGQPSGTATQPSMPPKTLWVEHVTNDPGSIENMLVGFAKDVYPNLAGKEDAIKKSPTFQAIKEHIAWYNHTSAGEPEVYIPSNYPDKKSLVDRFAGEVK